MSQLIFSKGNGDYIERGAHSTGPRSQTATASPPESMGARGAQGQAPADIQTGPSGGPL